MKGLFYTLLILTTLWVSYLYFSKPSEETLHDAFEYFQEGDYSSSLAELGDVGGSTDASQLSLYRAYNARAMGDLAQSDAFLKEALAALKKRSRPQLEQEILYNLALNAYLENNPQKLAEVVGEMEEIQDQPWAIFFQALSYYQQGDYAQALRLWNLPSNRLPLSQWMKETFSPTFTDQWLWRHLAEASLRNGDFVQARQLIETHQGRERASEEVILLKGLSYAKEAESKPAPARTAYLKLAKEEFSQLDLSAKPYLRERAWLVTLLNDTAQELIQSGNYRTLPFYFQYLTELGARTSLNTLAKQMEEQLRLNTEEQKWPQADAIAKLLAGLLPAAPRIQLADEYSTKAQENLLENSPVHATNLWRISYFLHPTPEIIEEEVVSAISTELSRSAQASREGDDTQPLIDLWQAQISSSEQHMKLSKHALAVANTLWKANRQQPALELIHDVITITPKSHRGALHAALSGTIEEMFLYTKQNRDIPGSRKLLKLLRELEVDRLAFATSERVQEFTEAGTMLLEQNQPSHALLQAEWALAIDPNNQEALQIAGNAAYESGDFPAAIDYFQSLEVLSEEQKAQVAVAKLLLTHDPTIEGRVREMANQGVLSELDLLRLALGYLTQNRIEEAEFWLSQAQGENPSAELIKIALTAQKEQWDVMRQELESLPAGLQRHPSLQVLALMGEATEMGQEEFEDRLEEILQRTPLGEQQWPPLGQEVWEAKLITYHPAFLLSKSQSAAGNYQEALDLLGALPESLPLVQMEKSNLLIETDQPLLAIKYLRELLAEENGSAREQQLQLLLAKAHFRLGDILNAYEILRQLQKTTEGETEEFHRLFARVAVSLRRFDWALVHFKTLLETSSLLPDDLAPYMAALAHRGDLTNALETWQQEGKSSLEERLYALREVVPFLQKSTLRELLEETLLGRDLSTAEALALFELQVEAGNYRQAIELLTEFEGSWRESLAGRLALATYYAKTGQREEFAEITSALGNIQLRALTALDVIVPFDRDTQNLQNLLEQVNILRKEFPENETLIQLYAHITLYLYRLATSQGNATPLAGRMNEAAFLASTLANRFPNLPIPLQLAAATSMEAQRQNDVFSRLVKAVELDPSFSEAYSDLSRLYAKSDDLDDAIRAQTQATRFAPYNPEMWRQLAQLYTLQEDTLEAIRAYNLAISLAPFVVQNYLDLALIYLDRHSPQEAFATLQAAISVAPNDTIVIRRLLDLLEDELFIVTSRDRKALLEQKETLFARLLQIDPEEAMKFRAESDPNSTPAWEPPE